MNCRLSGCVIPWTLTGRFVVSLEHYFRHHHHFLHAVVVVVVVADDKACLA
jgi:hypothetical protein